MEILHQLRFGSLSHSLLGFHISQVVGLNSSILAQVFLDFLLLRQKFDLNMLGSFFKYPLVN